MGDMVGNCMCQYVLNVIDAATGALQIRMEEWLGTRSLLSITDGSTTASKGRDRAPALNPDMQSPYEKLPYFRRSPKITDLLRIRWTPYVTL